MVKESGDKVKEAYFPLENVPGDFKFQVIIKYIWNSQSSSNFLYYKSSFMDEFKLARHKGHEHEEGLAILAVEPFYGMFDFNTDLFDATFSFGYDVEKECLTLQFNGQEFDKMK